MPGEVSHEVACHAVAVLLLHRPSRLHRQWVVKPSNHQHHHSEVLEEEGFPCEAAVALEDNHSHIQPQEQEVVMVTINHNNNNNRCHRCVAVVGLSEEAEEEENLNQHHQCFVVECPVE